MMYFAKFTIEQSHEINDFLKKNSNGIPANGIHYDRNGNVCFIYTSPDQKQQQIDGLVGSIDDSIAKWRAELLGYDVDLAVFRHLSRKGNKQAGQNIVNTEDLAGDMRKRIEIAEDLRAKIVSGEYHEMSKPASSPLSDNTESDKLNPKKGKK